MDERRWDGGEHRGVEEIEKEGHRGEGRGEGGRGGRGGRGGEGEGGEGEVNSLFSWEECHS